MPGRAGFALLLLVTAAAPARAEQACRPPPEDPSAEDVAEARDLFLRGSALARQEAWDRAYDLFQQSYARAGTPAALHNAAAALMELDRPREARDLFDCLLANHPEVDERTATSVRALRQEAVDRVAVLMLRSLPRDDDLEVTLDARPVGDDGTRPLRIESDPGEHALRVTHPGRRPFDWRGRLGAGQRLAVDVDLPEAPAPSVLSPSQPAPLTDDDGTIWTEPWLWIAVGAVVAGAITAGLLLHDSGQLEPRTSIVYEL